MGGMSYARGVIFEWLNETLCGKQRRGKAISSDRDAFVAIFEKYGGEIAADEARNLLDVAHLI
jgi:hypothetical protein